MSVCEGLSQVEISVGTSNEPLKSVQVLGVFSCGDTPLNRFSGGGGREGAYKVTVAKNEVTVRRIDDDQTGWVSELVFQCSVCPPSSVVSHRQRDENTPKITSVLPTSGIQHTVVTIEGTRLVPPGADSTSLSVYIGGRPCVVETVANETITCLAPEHAAGSFLPHFPHFLLASLPTYLPTLPYFLPSLTFFLHRASFTLFPLFSFLHLPSILSGVFIYIYIFIYTYLHIYIYI
jgi:hypothetical protein